MKFGTKKVFASSMAMILVFLAALSCGKGKPSQAVISFYSGTAMIKSGSTALRPVKIQERVQDGDVIETGDKSSVIVQVGDELIVRFEENTTVVVKSIKDLSKREISLEKGKVLSKVSKLKKGNEYFVKTPTAVASVRGTEFLTDYENGTTTVAVGKGKVSVVKTQTSEEKLVDLGSTVVVTDNMEMREINRVETLELKKLENTPSVKNVETMPLEDLKKEFENTGKSDEEINAEIDKLKGMSLDQIRAKYKRIDVVRMYNGRVIKGVILMRGQNMKILTPAGVVTVRAKDVRRTGVM